MQPIFMGSDIAPPGNGMRLILSLLFAVGVLALSLAMPPMAAYVHCGGMPEVAMASGPSHDHAAMDHTRQKSEHGRHDGKAADCLLRCLASCAGMVATGPSETLSFALASDRPRPVTETMLEGLPSRPLLPPPEPAFI